MDAWFIPGIATNRVLLNSYYDLVDTFLPFTDEVEAERN